jgi:hypothetical protein
MGNTAKVAAAISEAVSAAGREVALQAIGGADPRDITPGTLNAYDLVFLGAACHDADLARPVKELLAAIGDEPNFKIAGFVTHASYTPEGGARERGMHEIWALRWALSFRQAAEEKGFALLGYFGCQGTPSPPIERFIRNTIVKDEAEWHEYIQEVRKHSDEGDLRLAGDSARESWQGQIPSERRWCSP